MASGENINNIIIPCKEIRDCSEESTVTSFVPEVYHLGQQEDNLNTSTFIEANSTWLHKIPRRIRAKIWSYLNCSDLISLGKTCSKLQQEVLSLYEADRTSLALQGFLNILPFIPFHRYLDGATRNTLRLVCKKMKTSMDFYDDIDKSRSRRWGSTAKVSSLGYTNFDYLNENDSDLTTARSKNCRKTHIFDLYVQDLKRIFDKLDEATLKSAQNACGIFKRIILELKDHPFEEYKEHFSQLNLMDLPFEVHERVLNCCNASDCQRLRLVSKLMQYQVDTLAGVEVHLNDLKWGWNAKCGKLPPACSLIITNVENIHAVRYFTGEENSKLLTRVVLDGKFPAKAFIHLLERCKNLRYVGFTHALQMSSIEDELRKSFPIKRMPMELLALRAIDLKIQEVDLASNNIFRVHSWTWANAFEFMKTSLFYMPRLTSFSICEETIITHNLMYEVAEKVLKFINEHRHTLKYISIILNGHCLRSCGCPPFPYQLKNCDLEELQLAKFCHDCDWRISRPFASILNAQRSLKVLSCFKLSDWEFYAGVILNNRWTMHSVKIEKNLSPVIDLSAFSSCKNLEHLWISQYGSSNIGQQSFNNMRSIRVDQRLTNLDALPVSIKSLHILDQTVEAKQIKSIPQRLKHLEVLDLQFLGSWNGKTFGMLTETVSEILQLRKLNSLFLEEIRTLDTYLIGHSFESVLSEINLIPIEFSQIIKGFGCAVYGILVAERLPDSNFMPDWQQRVSSYFDCSVSQIEELYSCEYYHPADNYEEEEVEVNAEETEEE